MKHRVTVPALLLSGMLAVSGIIAACGGGEAQPTTPSNPPASSEVADAGAAPAVSASAAPVAEVDAAPPAPVASASAAPSGPPGAPGPGEWDSWSHDQKLEYMKTTVMPKTAAMFHDFDAKKYADAKCTLCHGAAAKTGSFKMPNPGLPKLDLSEAGFKTLKEKHAKVLEFMISLEHETAGLLGEQPYDPATQKGFGCLECHTPKGAKAAAKTDKAADKPADKKQ